MEWLASRGRLGSGYLSCVEIGFGRAGKVSCGRSGKGLVRQSGFGLFRNVSVRFVKAG